MPRARSRCRWRGGDRNTRTARYRFPAATAYLGTMAYRVRILLLLTLAFAARIAAADETIGPTDARGLQDAVDRLEPGDTLTLRAGDYDLSGVADLPHHAVTVNSRGVTIRGDAGARLVGPPADLFGPWTFGLLLYATD